MDKKRLSITIIILFLALGLTGSKNSNVVQNDDVSIPVLCYHNINPKKKAKNWNHPPKKFDAEMKYLFETGFKSITLDKFYRYITGEQVSLPKKPVLITFDDGWLTQYKYAVPILKKYDFHAVFFIYPAVINKRNRKRGLFCDFDELRKLLEAGYEIQSHTYGHENFSKLAKKRYTKKSRFKNHREHYLRELTKSKSILEEKLGINVEYLAYPFGVYNNEIIALGKKHGYKGMFSINEGVNYKGIHPFKLNRYCLSGSEKLDYFKKLVNSKPIKMDYTEPYDGEIVYNDELKTVSGAFSQDVDLEDCYFTAIMDGYGRKLNVDRETGSWNLEIKKKLKNGFHPVLINVTYRDHNKPLHQLMWTFETRSNRVKQAKKRASHKKTIKKKKK